MPRTTFRLYALVLLALVSAVSAACRSAEAQKQRHFDRGNQYAAEKKDEFAVVEYANAVRIDPKFGEARWALAQTLERMNNVRAAFPEYVRAADALPDNRDAQLKATRILVLAGRFEDAKARVSALLEKNPQDVDALVLRASAMALLKDPEGALAEIEEALKIQPDNSSTLTSLGAIRMQSGDAKQAEAAFRQAIAIAPTSIDPKLAFANFLLAAERRTEAEQVLKETLAIEPRHLLANRMLGVLYMATQRSAEAELPLKVVAEVSKTPAARFQLVDYYLAVRRTDEAKRLLTELAAEPNASPQAETKLAAIDYVEGRGAEAHKRIDAVLQRASKYTPALVAKAEWLRTENKLDEALAQAKAAVAGDPQSAEAHFVLGTIQGRRRESSEALKSFTEVLRLNPRAAAAQVELSRLNLASGNSTAALQFAEQAKQTAPESGAARVTLARALLASGDLPRAQAEISELLRANPDQAVVHTLNGLLEAQRNNDEAAGKSFARALELSPEDGEALGGLLAIDLRAKRTAGAIARVESALAKQPDRPELLTMAAQIYFAAAQNDRAEQMLRRAVTVDPSFSPGYAMLAQLYVRTKRIDEARREFERIVERDPSAAGARTMVGMLLEAQNKRGEAKKSYEATVAATDNAPVAANNLAYIYAEEGSSLDIALQLATSAKQRLPDNPSVDDTLGWIYYKKDLPALAIGPFQESLKKRPDNAEVLYHLGLAYAKLGEKAKASEALARALKLNASFPGNDVARETLASVSP